MKTLRVGSKGVEVKTLQMLLQKKEYPAHVDGIFGEKTEDVVILFQEDNHLDADGIVGTATWNVLFNTTNDKNIRINDTRFILPQKNYYSDPQPKRSVVLHHTNGWTVAKGTSDKPSMNHFNWWKSTDIHVSTAYSIDYKGNIYQHFDPKYWAWHLGLGGKYKKLDKQSIGIEITNEGYLTKNDNKFYWYSGKIALPYNRPNDEPIYVKNGWRGYNWFAPYSKEQVESALFLVKHLCNEFEINKNFIEDDEYHPEILEGFEGIYNHANVRDFPSTKPKWDLSPAFPFGEFKEKLI